MDEKTTQQKTVENENFPSFLYSLPTWIFMLQQKRENEISKYNDKKEVKISR